MQRERNSGKSCGNDLLVSELLLLLLAAVQREKRVGEHVAVYYYGGWRMYKRGRHIYGSTFMWFTVAGWP